MAKKHCRGYNFGCHKQEDKSSGLRESIHNVLGFFFFSLPLRIKTTFFISERCKPHVLQPNLDVHQNRPASDLGCFNVYMEKFWNNFLLKSVELRVWPVRKARMANHTGLERSTARFKHLYTGR